MGQFGVSKRKASVKGERRFLVSVGASSQSKEFDFYWRTVSSNSFHISFFLFSHFQKQVTNPIKVPVATNSTYNQMWPNDFFVCENHDSWFLWPRHLDLITLMKFCVLLAFNFFFLSTGYVVPLWTCRISLVLNSKCICVIDVLSDGIRCLLQWAIKFRCCVFP